MGQRMDRAAHFQISPRQRAIGQGQPPLSAVNLPPIEGEARDIRPRRRHGIADEENTVALGRQRVAHGRRMHMDAIGNQPGMNPLSRQRRPDQPRRAVAHLAHRVEQMGDAGRARVEGRHTGLVIRIAMAERDHDPRLGHRGDLRGAGVLWRDGDHEIRQTRGGA